MALRVVSRFYITYADAVQTMADLEAAGVPDSDISLIESEDDARLPQEIVKDAAQPPALAGATMGIGSGGGIGALIGIGAIDWPLLDPVVALGWIPITVIGAVIGAGIGALVGMVTKMGVSSRQAHSFAAGLQRGEHLVMVRIDETLVGQVEAIMAQSHVQPNAEAPLPPAPAMTLAETREAIHRDEARIQYTSE